MSYTVLARKYRSGTLDDLVGQEAIATTLKNAVTSGRVHHGYLFTGTRGVGKTSTARLLAKSLTCLNSSAPTPTPCLSCESCLRIAEGEDLDVIEIDAASNTGVDNIRDLRSNAAYRPSRSRFKVYIIDEVHMLSTGAFNALLKTLEEPPDHVKFILATTEIQKVPATIVSRCQRFDFKSIAPDEIAEHLRSILKQEGIETEETVVRRVSRLANGSMRDALSLLDQLISFGAGRLTTEMMDDILPPMYDEVVGALFQRVAENDVAGALGCVEQCLSRGQTMDRFCELAVSHLRSLMLLNVCGGDTELVDVPASVRSEMAEQSKGFDATTYVYMIGVMEEVRRAIKSSNASRALIDAAIVRLAMATNFSDVETLIAQLERGGAVSESNMSSAGTKNRSSPAVPSARRVDPPRTTASRSQTTMQRSPAGGGPNRPAPSVSSPSTASVSSADRARVSRDPNVRRAMDLFDGALAGVERAVTVTEETQDDGGGSDVG